MPSIPTPSETSSYDDLGYFADFDDSHDTHEGDPHYTHEDDSHETHEDNSHQTREDDSHETREDDSHQTHEDKSNCGGSVSGSSHATHVNDCVKEQSQHADCDPGAIHSDQQEQGGVINGNYCSGIRRVWGWLRGMVDALVACTLKLVVRCGGS